MSAATPTPTPSSHWAFMALRRLAEAAMALSLAGMVLAVFLNVLLRYFFNTGLAISEELSRLLFVWLVCIGAVLALAEGKHLGFDMVTSRLRGLPAAFLAIAECDILADQNRLMADRLRAAGVPVEARIYRGATHSFLESVSISALASRAFDDAAQWLRMTLASGDVHGRTV